MTKILAPKGIARANTMRAAVRGPTPTQAHPSHPSHAKAQPAKGQASSAKRKVVD